MATLPVKIASASIPFLYFLVSSVFSFIALHTHPSKRLIYALPIVVPAILSFNNITRLPEWLGLNNIWGFVMTIYVAHITAVLYIEKFVLPSSSDGSPPSVLVTTDRSKSLAHWDLRAAYRVWNNPRWLKFPGDKQTFESSVDRRAQLEKSPPHWRLIFLFKCLARMLAFWLSQYVFMQYLLPLMLQGSTIYSFRPELEPLLSRLPVTFSRASSNDQAFGFPITSQELLPRLAITMTWAVMVYISLNICHAALSIFFALVMRFDMPDDWPPLFGGVGNITSIRSFWGDFWHRIVVKGYGSHAALLSRVILGQNAGRLANKMLVVFGIFLFSGFAHSAVAWRLNGPECGIWRDTWWFLENWAAGLGEVIALKLARQLALRVSLEKNMERMLNGPVGRVLGALWVCFFFFWTVPKWQYPKLYCAAWQKVSETSMDVDLSGL